MTLRLGGDGAITGCTSLEEPTISISGLTMTTPIEAISGTAAAPSYTFSGDTDNGLYYAGTNSIGVSTAGTSAIVVDASQNVGIGTTSPDALLTAKASSGKIARFRTADTNFFGIDIGTNGSNYTFIESVKGGTGSYQPLSFFVGGSRAVDIDTSGRLLVGTSSDFTNGTGTAIQSVASAGGQIALGRDASSLTAGSLVGRLRWYSNVGGTAEETARISADADGTYALGDKPTRLVFSTTADGASSPTERMRIDSSGTTSITSNVAVNGLELGSRTLQLHDSGTSDAMLFGNNSGYLSIQGGASQPGSGITLSGRSASSDAATIRFYTEDVSNNLSSYERMRIDSSGRLLVGTTSARTKYLNTTAYGALMNLEGTSNSNRIVSFVHNDNSGGPIFVLGTSGAIGTPGSNTLVSSNTNFGMISFQGADGTELVEAARITAEVDGTPGANDMPGKLMFYTTADGASGPTERMRITNQGAIWAAVNTNVEQHGSSIHYNGWSQGNGNQWAGTFRNLGSSGGYGLIIAHPNSSTSDTAYWFLNCNNSAGTKAIIYTNGGLANYQSNNANLCDEREKKNIEALDSTWSCLKNWELKKFHYNEDADTDDKRYGVIAQQVEQYCPEVITDWTKQKAEDAVLDEDGNVVTPAKEEIVRMGVKEQQMYWMAIKALQEAQDRIETLEASNAALEQRLTDAGL